MASYQRYRMFRACEQNYLRLLQNMFKQKLRKDKASVLKIVSEKKDGLTPLIRACRRGHIKVVRYLVSVCRADIHQVADWSALYHDMQGASPLLCAVVSGHLRVVKFLIFAGADVNFTSHPKWTPLRAATHLGFPDIVKVLLDNGADLELATWHGHAHPDVKWTRRHRDIWNMIRAKSKRIGTYSYYFVCRVFRSWVKGGFYGACYHFMYLSNFNKILQEGNYELMRRYVDYFLQSLKARAGEYEGVLFMITFDVFLLKLIWLIRDKLSNQNLEKLEKHYFDLLCLEKSNPLSGKTMLHSVCCAEENDSPDRTAYMAQFLITLGANVNAQNFYGDTPLHMAATKRQFNAQLVDLLIHNGAHIDQVNPDNKTPMDLQPIDDASVSELRYPVRHQTLQCLAALAVCKYNVPYEDNNVTQACMEAIEQHSPKCRLLLS